MNVKIFPVIYTELRPDVTLDEGNIHMEGLFMASGLFSQLISMGMTASWVILVVLAVRLLFWVQ